ncbi:MAG TPA: hypothetical protein DEP35_19415 [Deltaproteobacteria bacterium]|nr:hypothetical protein [Deltaproteobacteria bacterium]
MRSARFLQSGLAFALLVSASAAWSHGQGGGHGGHGFHSGRGRAFGFRGFGHHFHGGALFISPFEPFGLEPEPFSPGIAVGPLGCEDGLGVPVGCSYFPPGIGLLDEGPSLPEEPFAATEEIDPSRARWREPEPGECPPNQKLLRLPGQPKWRCADPRLHHAEAAGSAP